MFEQLSGAQQQSIGSMLHGAWRVVTGTVGGLLGVDLTSAAGLASAGGAAGGGGGGGWMGQQQQESYNGRKVRDSHYHLEVGLDELYNGAERQIRVERQEVCATCHGDGADPAFGRSRCRDCDGQGYTIFEQRFGRQTQRFQRACNRCGGSGSVVNRRCGECNGNGLVRAQVLHNVTVKPGMKIGDVITLKRVGDSVIEPAEPGDVVFELTPRRDFHAGVFQRTGDDDLRATITVPLKEALLGFKKELTHFDKRKVGISRHGQVTQHGQVEKVIGEGMPKQDSRYGERGDLYVTFEVAFPTGLKPANQKLIQDAFQ
jgi:DnaJ-class molecular chaperone